MEEEEEMVAPQMAMPPVMRVAALSMTADLIIAFGIIFALLGIAAFVTDLFGVKGAGEFLVGLALCLIGAALLSISKRQMASMPPPRPRAVARPPPVPGMDKKDESASYR
ncbi:MAG: hypothetical protein AB1295_04735 [Candidatus Micrarchaeota archaeon]